MKCTGQNQLDNYKLKECILITNQLAYESSGYQSGINYIVYDEMLVNVDEIFSNVHWKHQFITAVVHTI